MSGFISRSDSYVLSFYSHLLLMILPFALIEYLSSHFQDSYFKDAYSPSSPSLCISSGEHLQCFETKKSASSSKMSILSIPGGRDSAQKAPLSFSNRESGSKTLIGKPLLASPNHSSFKKRAWLSKPVRATMLFDPFLYVNNFEEKRLVKGTQVFIHSRFQDSCYISEVHPLSMSFLSKLIWAVPCCSLIIDNLEEVKQIPERKPKLPPQLRIIETSLLTPREVRPGLSFIPTLHMKPRFLTVKRQPLPTNKRLIILKHFLYDDGNDSLCEALNVKMMWDELGRAWVSKQISGPGYIPHEIFDLEDVDQKQDEKGNSKNFLKSKYQPFATTSSVSISLPRVWLSKLKYPCGSSCSGALNLFEDSFCWFIGRLYLHKQLKTDLDQKLLSTSLGWVEACHAKGELAGKWGWVPGGYLDIPFIKSLYLVFFDSSTDTMSGIRPPVELLLPPRPKAVYPEGSPFVRVITYEPMGYQYIHNDSDRDDFGINKRGKVTLIRCTKPKWTKMIKQEVAKACEVASSKDNKSASLASLCPVYPAPHPLYVEIKEEIKKKPFCKDTWERMRYVKSLGSGSFGHVYLYEDPFEEDAKQFEAFKLIKESFRGAPSNPKKSFYAIKMMHLRNATPESILQELRALDTVSELMRQDPSIPAYFPVYYGSLLLELPLAYLWNDSERLQMSRSKADSKTTLTTFTPREPFVLAFMEFIEGPTLREVIAGTFEIEKTEQEHRKMHDAKSILSHTSPFLSLQVKANILYHLARAYSILAIKKSLIHKDIKAINIILRMIHRKASESLSSESVLNPEVEYVPVIVDYGGSCGKEDSHAKCDSTTTLLYASPELAELITQRRGRRVAKRASESKANVHVCNEGHAVWSYGCVALEVAIGTRVYHWYESDGDEKDLMYILLNPIPTRYACRPGQESNVYYDRSIKDNDSRTVRTKNYALIDGKKVRSFFVHVPEEFRTLLEKIFCCSLQKRPTFYEVTQNEFFLKHSEQAQADMEIRKIQELQETSQGLSQGSLLKQMKDDDNYKAEI